MSTRRSQNDTALGEFLALVEKRAFVIARLSTRNDDAALDAVQDTMLKMVRHYADKPAAQWPPLFFKILSNRLGDHHRKRGFARLVRWRGNGSHQDSGPDAVEQLADEAPRPEDALGADEMRTAVTQALSTLPERQRQVFLLRQWQGMSVEETAQALGLSGGSVKTHLSRAMKALRERLPEYARS